MIARSAGQATIAFLCSLPTAFELDQSYSGCEAESSGTTVLADAVGGEKEVVERLDPIFAALAPGECKIEKTPYREDRDPHVERGYLYCGPAGSGHFVKMVHNSIPRPCRHQRHRRGTP